MFWDSGVILKYRKSAGRLGEVLLRDDEFPQVVAFVSILDEFKQSVFVADAGGAVKVRTIHLHSFEYPPFFFLPILSRKITALGLYVYSTANFV